MDPDQITSPLQEEPEITPIAPEPTIVIVPEPVPEAIPEPVPEVIQPPTPVNNLPEPTIEIPEVPSQIPEQTVPEPVPETVQPLPPAPIPVPQPPAPPVPVFDVNSLTDEQLKAASALYAKKNQKVLSQKGVEKRQAVAKENIQNITSFIASHSPANNRTIARALNLPPRRVQHYMQILTKNGTVTATGWGASRQYFKK